MDSMQRLSYMNLRPIQWLSNSTNSRIKECIVAVIFYVSRGDFINFHKCSLLNSLKPLS